MIEFGEKNIISFQDENSLYETIGYLANYTARGMNISVENYPNKWGIEYRIWLGNVRNAPYCMRSVLSEGVGNYDARLNCNEFITFLINSHNFAIGATQNVDIIRASIDNEYIEDFNRGYNL
ncbi:hypothetical protein [Paraclostridium bifermentans]|uniref:hypothetical protein n=1 Tax=Paraclostridium bifermentans TaxID=1490 RepID=UPI00359CAFE3